MDHTADTQRPLPEAETPIEDLEFAGHAALRRALEMRTYLEDCIISEEDVGSVLDELFDLIRLGMR